MGHHLLHHGRNGIANKMLLERVRGILDGWKTKLLSKAGRPTLAKSVINSMGVFQMQVRRMPTGVHRALDRCVRGCVWGNHDGHRRIHPISWKVLCRPKERGGFGLRKVEGMNKSLLTKLGWRLANNEEGLWANILRRKYGLSELGPVNIRHKQ